MKTALFSALAVLAVPVVAAQTPASAPTPLNPIGNYQFQVMLPDGNAIGGQFTIKGEKDKWEGTIVSDIAPEMPISGIGVEGQVLTFALTAPDGTSLPLRLTFAGDDFSGQINYQGVAMMISGKRQRAP